MKKKKISNKNIIISILILALLCVTCYIVYAYKYNNNDNDIRNNIDVRNNSNTRNINIGSDFMGVDKKPAIYIYTKYPEKQSVEIIPKNKKSNFTLLIPEFTFGNTWEYETNPQNGNTINVNGIEYDYLRYTIEMPYEFNQKGWHVKGENIESFFNDKLTKMNFNEKEKEDFLEYWLTRYEKKDSYYFISFKYNEEIEKYIELKFDKEPETIFRVLLESYELEKEQINENLKYENIKDKLDKYLIKSALRNSDFDVFEWGGIFPN